MPTVIVQAMPQGSPVLWLVNNFKYQSLTCEGNIKVGSLEGKKVWKGELPSLPFP